MLIASQVGIAIIMLLSEVLDILAKMSGAMQRKIADFSKLPTLVSATIESLEDLKKEDSDLGF